jgi:hypothetical protein
MKKGSEIFVGIDTAKAHNAVTVAEAGRDGEVRYLGTFDNTPDAVAKLVRKLSSRYEKLYFCYEAGSTGHGLYRRILLRYGAKTEVCDTRRSRRDGRFLLRITDAGSDEGGKNWACLASLIETCKLNGVNPQTYVTDLLTRPVNGWPQNRINELMPWHWAPRQPS